MTEQQQQQQQRRVVERACWGCGVVVGQEVVTTCRGTVSPAALYVGQQHLPTPASLICRPICRTLAPSHTASKLLIYRTVPGGQSTAAAEEAVQLQVCLSHRAMARSHRVSHSN
jgi:hypothetical protein